jgi:acetyl esterase/lipase
LRPERHRYGRRPAQFAELRRPEGASPPPVAVVIHGGFWKARYGRRLMGAVCEDLAARGWAAWNVEYRRLGPLSRGGWPATLDDVGAAIDALAGVPGLDLRRVVAVGHSAGGHLAAWAATRGDEAAVRVTGVVAQAGVVDLRLASELRLSNGVVHRFLGGTPDAVPDRYAAASPAERLPLGVPVLLTHGGRGENVPLQMSERFAAAARAAGDDVSLCVLEDEDHFGHIDPGNPLWRAAAEWMEARR